MKKKISITFFVSGILLFAGLTLTDYFIKFPSMLYVILSLLCTGITVSGVVLYFLKRDDNIYMNTEDKMKKKWWYVLSFKK